MGLMERVCSFMFRSNQVYWILTYLKMCMFENYFVSVISMVATRIYPSENNDGQK